MGGSSYGPHGVLLGACHIAVSAVHRAQIDHQQNKLQLFYRALLKMRLSQCRNGEYLMFDSKITLLDFLH